VVVHFVGIDQIVDHEITIFIS